MHAEEAVNPLLKTTEGAKVEASEGLSSSVAENLLVQFGRNELSENKVPKSYIFAELLWQPMPLMM